MTQASITPLTEFIAKRIYDLRTRRTQSEIAAKAGFVSTNMLSMIKSGKARLPLERVMGLASALECDPGDLVRLALQESVPEAVIRQLLASQVAPAVQKVDADVRIQIRAAQVDLTRIERYLEHVISRVDGVRRRLKAIPGDQREGR